MIGPRVQVVMRTKNRPLFLARALQSVASQTYPDWHCTVVNDGGVPGEVDKVVAALGDDIRPQISIMHNAFSVGMEAASNVGLCDCSADYYVIHDDDDSWAPDFLEVCVNALESQKAGSVQGVVARTIKVMEGVEGDELITRKTSVFLPEVTSFTIPRVAQNNPFMPIAFVYSKKALELLEGYDETLPVVGDWEFNLRFVRHFDIAYVPNTTAYYHVRMGSRGDSSDNSISKALSHQHYRSLIINRHIRQAMDEGSLTLGHMLAAAEPGLHSNRLGEKLSHWYPKLRKWRPGALLARIWGGK
ncbi:glycosyltransferase family 2 protein [Halomonas sp. I1]|uniref:glycosyltransferase family 2 protein n=1 Tax=Halomonas sp. I1 TaxID=393536 RepID=UPI0028DE64EF|nr:glycosyltransferase family 2 protein [Halomonas sp. I1]MDT8894902.1 glycosyltransferase family 2 protein [Halomonas sp. I1]